MAPPLERPKSSRRNRDRAWKIYCYHCHRPPSTILVARTIYIRCVTPRSGIVPVHSLKTLISSLGAQEFFLCGGSYYCPEQSSFAGAGSCCWLTWCSLPRWCNLFPWLAACDPRLAMLNNWSGLVSDTPTLWVANQVICLKQCLCLCILEAENAC